MAYVLNIGSDMIVLEARADVLRFAGYEAVSCTNDKEALTLAADACAVILGVSLPRESKATVSRAIRSISRVPVICIDSQHFDCKCVCDEHLHSLDGPKALLDLLERLGVPKSAQANSNG